MVFSSHVFVFYFLPLALLFYYAGPRGMRNFTLTVASYVFYAWMNPYFILLIAWSTVVDYCCGNLIYGHWRLLGPVTVQANGEPRASEAQRKLFVPVSLISSHELLFFFQYLLFAHGNQNARR